MTGSGTDGADARAVRGAGVVSVAAGMFCGALVFVSGMARSPVGMWIGLGVVGVAGVVAGLVLRLLWGVRFWVHTDRRSPLWRVERVILVAGNAGVLLLALHWLFRTDMAGVAVFWAPAAAVVAAPAVVAGWWALRQVPADGRGIGSG